MYDVTSTFKILIVYKIKTNHDYQYQTTKVLLSANTRATSLMLT